MNTQEMIRSLEQKIAISEAKIKSIEEDMLDEEIMAESGYYLQQDRNNEIEYCNVLYKKIHKLQEQQE
jgi:hypothetical protein